MDAVLTAAMATVALLVVSAAGLTELISRRSDSDRATPGTTASLLIMIVATAVFAGLSVLVAHLMGAL